MRLRLSVLMNRYCTMCLFALLVFLIKKPQSPGKYEFTLSVLIRIYYFCREEQSCIINLAFTLAEQECFIYNWESLEKAMLLS
uniref:Secreted protein n=1 Tax=Rhipicephalus appendiculatus TaxID=34631 RepID=A0A131YBX8_RHIAP